MSPKIAGQIIFRESGKTVGEDDNSKLMMFTGIIRVPKDCLIKGEHQYVLFSDSEGLTGLLPLNLVTSEGVIDRTEQLQGFTIGQTLTEPLWRV
jgi:hypothetical protein